MSNTTLEQKPTSIFPNDEIEHIKADYLTMPTWFLLTVLILAFFVLKSFIYHPDEKRKGR
jgi:hypothetical protein